MDMPNNAISALPITDKLQARATAIFILSGWSGLDNE